VQERDTQDVDGQHPRRNPPWQVPGAAVRSPPSAQRHSGRIVGHNHGVDPSAYSDEFLGASRSLIDGQWDWPVHGLGHPPAEGTSGWYVWTGELSDADDFFQPWHQVHFVERCPEVAHMLQLPPGSRFLVAPGHEDVWHDSSLLDV